MKIIIGLGNPEKKYDDTRHNVGFFMLNKLRSDWEFPEFEFSKKFNAEVSKGNLKEEEVLLVKPQTFMNLSGVTVKSILDFYKIAPEDILVIHDDIDISLDKYKIATDSSSAGHNGVQNIIDQLGTQKFRRLRVGIGQEKEGAIVCRLGVHDFVLGKFSKEETDIMEKISIDILGEIKKIL